MHLTKAAMTSINTLGIKFSIDALSAQQNKTIESKKGS